MSNVSRGGLNRLVATVDTVAKKVTRNAQCHQWQGRRPEHGAMVSNPSQSVVSDPGSSVSQRVQGVNSSLVPPVRWSTAAAVDVDEDWHEEWCHDGKSDWHEDCHQDCGLSPIQRNTRVSDTTMKVPIWCAESLAQFRIRNSRKMRK